MPLAMHPDGCTPAFFNVARASWIVMHRASIAFPCAPSRRQIDAFWHWLCGFGLVLPCSECAEHWRYVMRRLRTKRSRLLGSRSAAVSFLFDLHNMWNDNKRRSIMSFVEFCTIYDVQQQDMISYCPVLDRTIGSHIRHKTVPTGSVDV